MNRPGAGIRGQRCLTALALTILSCSSQTTASGMYTPSLLIKSSFCKTYTCRLLSSADGFSKFAVSDKAKSVSVTLFLDDNKMTADRVSIYLKSGSLQFGAMPAESTLLQAFFLWAAGKKLDLKSDIFAAQSLADGGSVNYADLWQGMVGRRNMTIYVKSLPDGSLNPMKGQLVYGVMPTKAFPPDH